MKKYFGSYEDVREQLIKDYDNNDVCIAEILADACFPEWSAEDVVRIYCDLMHNFEGDLYYLINRDNYPEHIVTDLSTGNVTDIFYVETWCDKDLKGRGVDEKDFDSFRMNVCGAFEDKSYRNEQIDDVAWYLRKG